MGLGMGTVSSVVAAVSLPDGVPGEGYSTRTWAVTGTPAAHPSGSSSGWVGRTVTPSFGSDSYGSGTATLSASPQDPMEKGTGTSEPLGSSTTPTMSVGSPRALQSTSGQPAPGTPVPLQEGITEKEHVSDSSILTGDVPAPSEGLSPSVTLTPAAPLVLGTEAPSSATSSATDDDGLMQPHRAVTVEWTPGTAQTVVLSDVQHSTGTSPHSLTWSPAELHTASVRLSQEVTPGLDEATSPLFTTASITVGNPEPASTMSDRVTSPTVPATTGSSHHAGIQKSGTMIAPGTASATITPPAVDGVSEATAPGLPAPGTVGDGLHGDTAVTHPRVTSQLHATTTAALGTSTTAMDVSSAPHLSTAPYAVLGSAETVSIAAKATTGTAVLQTEGTPMGLGMGTVSSAVAAVSLPDGVPGGGYSTRTSEMTGTSAIHPDSSTSGWAGRTVTAGFGSDPYGPGTATLSPAPHSPADKGTGISVPLGSSTAPMKTVGSPRALQSTSGQAAPGSTLPLQEITVTEERMHATRLLTGDVPAPSEGLSPAVRHVPATPLVLGTEAPSSATSTATDDSGLVQPHRAVTVEWTPGTAQTVVLSDVQHSTGTSPHSLTWSPGELHTASVRLSQEVTPGLDEATSPLFTTASITVGNPEPTSTMSDRVTSPTVPATTGSSHHAGIQKSGTMIPPGTASATITPPAVDGVSEATAPGLPAPGRSGDGLHGDTAVTHPRVTSQLHATTTAALGTSTTAMDVSSAPHLSTAPYAVLGSAETVSIAAKATTGTAVLQTEGTPMGLGMGTVSSVVAAVSLPDGVPGEGYSTRTWAVTGEAAGLALGLVMLGSKNAQAIEDMVGYAQETQHEKILRGLAVGIALVMYGRMEEADALIESLCRDKDPILRRSGMYTVAMAYCGSGNNKAIRRLLHVAVSDVNDDVRRAAVESLGFILFRTPEQCPSVVSLLSESYNPHVRYGAAMALGICCAGTGNKEAINLLEPMTNDPVNYVRQGALIASALIMIQQTEITCPKVSQFRQLYSKVINDKHDDVMAKFGAILAQGILDAGGHNVTISLQSRTGHTHMPSVVGVLVFTQFWFWFPLSHFLSLAFTPTCVIGLNKDLKMPKVQYKSNCKPSTFAYPPPLEVPKEKEKEKVSTAVLSITAKAKKKEKEKEKEKKEEEKMEVDETEKKDEKEKKKEPEPNFQLLDNPARVMPAQLKVLTMTESCRYQPFKPLSIGGIIILKDTSEDMEELVEPVAAHGPKIEEEEQEPEPPEPFEYIDD
uniref:26S proteasome regulatory subunit RPN2 C-terminal domain-containing protein n=6 Tax=Amniota TaxID=32524 RepID=G1N7N3_MELGA